MPKRGKNYDSKARFVNVAFRDKKKAANILRQKATALENCHNIDEVAIGLSDILFCHPSTIYRLYE